MTVSRQPDRAEADQRLFCKDEHAVMRAQLARAMRSPPVPPIEIPDSLAAK